MLHLQNIVILTVHIVQPVNPLLETPFKLVWLLALAPSSFFSIPLPRYQNGVLSCISSSMRKKKSHTEQN